MTTTGSNLVAFGELLKGFRTRRYMTQQHLAEAVGVHRNAIGRWEHGDFLPASRGMILELARKLHLDSQETRYLLETSLTALSPGFQIPLYRNPFFTGRAGILETLHTHLITDRVLAPTQSYALHGLGGMGKTQIALEYAYRYALEYSAVFWIAAETSTSIINSMIRIAEALQLPTCQETEPQHIVTAVQRWLATHRMWLLIWDNSEDPTLLQHFLPPVRQGTILITTRNPVQGTLAQGLELLPMEPEEGLLFLSRRAKVPGAEITDELVKLFAQRLPGEYRAAKKLVEMMGGLPLALDQIGAYIDETGCSFSVYLQRYERQREPLLDRRGTSCENHPHSVVSTLELSFQQVEQRNPVALELLRCCAFVPAHAIPEELFLAKTSHLGPILEPIASDPCQFDLALATLRKQSLLQRNSETHTLSLHPLVQTVLQEKMNRHEHIKWTKRIVSASNALFPEVSLEVWDQCEHLLPPLISRQGKPVLRSKRITVYGEAGQVAYTRLVHMREVTITCMVCGQTVTQLRYPGGQIRFCSDACKQIRAEQINEERVYKQREKRRARREGSRYPLRQQV